MQTAMRIDEIADRLGARVVPRGSHGDDGRGVIGRGRGFGLRQHGGSTTLDVYVRI
ncbi:hypothetical protein [Candidatus Burkholderia verschuerenii]|uniref:hypothetical protein n=1 Tax=Candidatus Burkholderia verschuerenii TaxID=242163 RepID=UPI001E2F9994|nr:hypothetical protein [Candidatus Burkholderia verschuerenii]